MIAEQEFKDILCNFASGVTVVTFADSIGNDGLTVSAFCSLSLNPPSILTGIGSNADCHDRLTQSKYFGVNILHKHQEDIVFAFAAQGDAKHKALHKLGIHWQLSPQGVPLFDCLAQLECKKQTLHTGGDHSILIGEVQAGRVCDGNAEPMIYVRRGFS